MICQLALGEPDSVHDSGTLRMTTTKAYDNLKRLTSISSIGGASSASPISFNYSYNRWEAPRHLPDRTIQIRFQRSAPASRVVVYYKGERMGEARLLNAVANDRKPLNQPPTEI
jgi:hypothetical protein